MRILTARQAQVLDKLVQLADGSIELVEEALTTLNQQRGGPAELREIVAYIVQHKEDRA